jgi:ABC-2 type transport system permease protein
MSLRSFLRKELAWSRRRLVPLLLLFVLLPASFGYVTTGFDNVLPTDTPVGIVAESDDVSEDDLAVARGALAFFSDPRTYGTTEAAFRALEREQVYAVVRVPAGVTDTDERSTVRVYVHGSMVPYHQPSEAVVNVLRFRLQEILEGSIQIERTVVGQRHSLSAYLVPTFLLVMVLVLGLGYLPYNLAAEQPVLDRVRVEASIEALLASKLAFFGVLLLVPIGVFQVASFVFGYDIVLGPAPILVSLLVFVSAGAFGSAVVLFTRFSTWGYLLNLLTLFAVLLFSGLLYPAGFFSPIRREVVRLLPTHYAMIAIRGTTLRGGTIGTYRWWILGLIVLAVTTLGIAWLAINSYERRA